MWIVSCLPEWQQRVRSRGVVYVQWQTCRPPACLPRGKTTNQNIQNARNCHFTNRLAAMRDKSSVFVSRKLFFFVRPPSRKKGRLPDRLAKTRVGPPHSGRLAETNWESSVSFFFFFGRPLSRKRAGRRPPACLPACQLSGNPTGQIGRNTCGSPLFGQIDQNTPHHEIVFFSRSQTANTPARPRLCTIRALLGLTEKRRSAQEQLAPNTTNRTTTNNQQK